jgi:hypothetical protein
MRCSGATRRLFEQTRRVLVLRLQSMGPSTKSMVGVMIDPYSQWKERQGRYRFGMGTHGWQFDIRFGQD